MPSVSAEEKVPGLKSLFFLFETSLPLHPINSQGGNFAFRGASKHKTIPVYSVSHTLCLQTGGDVYLKSCLLASSLSAWNVSHLQLGSMNYLLLSRKRGRWAVTPWWWEGESSASPVHLLSVLLGWALCRLWAGCPCPAGQGCSCSYGILHTLHIYDPACNLPPPLSGTP